MVRLLGFRDRRDIRPEHATEVQPKGLRPYIARQWPFLLAIAALSGLSSLASVLQPWPLKMLVDYAVGGQPMPDPLRAVFHTAFSEASPTVIVMAAAIGSIGVYALSTVLQSALTWTWSVMGQRMVHELTIDVFHRLQRLSLRFHSRQPVGDSLTRLSTDTWSVYTLTTGVMTPGQHVLVLAMTGVVAWRLDPYLAALTLGLAPLLAVSSLFFGKKLKRRARQGRDAQSRLLSFVQQTLTAIPVVQAFSREALNRQHFDALSTDAVALSQRGVLLGSIFGLVNGVIITVGSAIVLYAGGERVLSGALSLGTLLVFLSYSRSMEQAAESLMTTYGTLKPVEASIDRVVEILNLKDGIEEASVPTPVPIAPGDRGVQLCLRNVTFGYEPDRPVLKNVNLEVPAGETLAIVGQSGAGKTTLVSLIPRFFDPWTGHVSVNGIDLKELSISAWRAQVAMVLQEPFLFAMSVADNIAYGRPSAAREDIVAAAVAARADEFIRQLPEGYDTVLGQRGVTLSGGQRQRLSIARAFLKNAPVLILDEPTSAVDAETESGLMEALDRLTRGRTTLIIAHRLSTVRKADRIAVLEDGNVIECGTRSELLSAAGAFAKLHALQFADSERIVAV